MKNNEILSVGNRIERLIPIPENQPIIMEYAKVDDKPHVFLNHEGEIVGYIWFSIHEKTMDIEMIEMIQKEEGFGTEAIQFLFKEFAIEEIIGHVLGEVGMRAYWFWESLGANMSVPMDEVDGYVERDCYFKLNRTCFE